MAKETVNGVTNFYGPRGRFDNDEASLYGVGPIRSQVVYFDGVNYSQVSFKLPAGASLVGTPLVEIEEAFDLGGTTPVINVGVSGSTATNYAVQISEAQAEAIGTYLSAAPAGTLALTAAPLTAEATIVVALGGTNPTAAAKGKAKVMFQYRVI